MHQLLQLMRDYGTAHLALKTNADLHFVQLAGQRKKDGEDLTSSLTNFSGFRTQYW